MRERGAFVQRPRGSPKLTHGAGRRKANVVFVAIRRENSSNSNFLHCVLS
jgi:hypothetical protein